jgi:thiamine pyrophosphate-dependent acetolactate synthase large subunit-like protein
MINTAEMFRMFLPHRGDAIVIPGRGGRHWVETTNNEKLDATLGDPAMGGHSGFGLGIALAQPNRKVYLFDSDGDIHMSMGMLATIAEQAPKNLYHFVLDNEIYATTGGQPVPNAKVVDYAAIATAAGYPRAFSFTELEDLEKALPEIIEGGGPVFVHMKVYPEVQNEAIGTRKPWNPRARTKVITDVRGALTGQG